MVDINKLVYSDPRIKKLSWIKMMKYENYMNQKISKITGFEDMSNSQIESAIISFRNSFFK
ncbi:hypothetical protein [Sebaldella sp. S0638]|uniref:hypothetical protein n=1 Tax=Sebaldella sp. S0638 TaxID=2957809 RepID=UPI00209F02F2|nr:hypothetical protein [Sebaldella sp. S0638]MCP1226004.1 hypothetical protein [Sebaldella sp. S0638]